MGLALLKEDFDELVAPPPSMDWERAVSAVNDLKEFQKVVDVFDKQTTEWLTGLRGRLDRGLPMILEKAREIPQPQREETALPYLDAAIAAAEEAIQAHKSPIHEKPEAKATFDRLKAVSGPAGRFLRKQINRVEDLRVKRHNGVVDLYYAMLAFRSQIEVDGEGGETFSDAKSLGDFLRKQVA